MKTSIETTPKSICISCLGRKESCFDANYQYALYQWNVDFSLVNLLQGYQVSPSSAAGINDSGVVLGSYYQYGGTVGFVEGSNRIHLNSLIPYGSPWIAEALAINNAGQILADSGGSTPHAYFLTPIAP